MSRAKLLITFLLGFLCKPILADLNSTHNSTLEKHNHDLIEMVEIGGEQFPRGVNLSASFPKEVPQQGKLPHCAVFSVVALAESVCSMALHKPIDLSEAYAVFVTFRDKLRKQRGSDTLPPPEEFAKHLLQDWGGYDPRHVFQSLFQGATCKEGSISQETEFAEYVVAVKLALMQANRLKISEEDRKLPQTGPNHDVTKDPDLLACIEKLDPLVTFPKLSSLEIMKLLAMGNPLLCIRKQGPHDHALIIAGYRLKKDKIDAVEWLKRDSASTYGVGEPSWEERPFGNEPCSIVMGVFPKGETDKISSEMSRIAPLGNFIRAASKTKEKFLESVEKWLQGNKLRVY